MNLKMKILIIGSSGQVGRCLKDEFLKTDFNLKFLGRDNLDICDTSELKKICKSYKPHFIINATAYTNVDQAENSRDEAYQINYHAVKSLALICKEIDSTLIHISTDYVFDGKLTRPYKEDDITNPINIYGSSKLKGENAIVSSKCKYIILRTAWIYSEYRKNFLKTIVNLARKRKELKIIDDQHGSPTYARHLAKAIVFIIPYINHKNNCEVYNYAGDIDCSWAVFANKIINEAEKCKLIKSKPEIIKINSSEYITLAERPINSRLNSSKFESTFVYKSSNLATGIAETLKKSL